MYRHALALLAVGALAACDAPAVQSPHLRAPAAPSRTTVSNQQAWVPETFTLFNPCNGDLVATSGTVHASLMTDPSGVLTVHENGTDLSGTAADGTSYQFVRISRAEIRTNPLDELYTAEYRVVSQGRDPNFLLDFTAHIYVDAQGAFHVDFVKTSASCVG